MKVNVPSSVFDGQDSSTTVGLKYFREGSWFDAKSYGCDCEGFGVRTKVLSSGSTFWGGANKSSGGVSSLTASPLISGGLTAITLVTVISVKHEFTPSPELLIFMK